MKITLMTRALAAALAFTPLAALADEAALMRRIDALAAELDKVKAELAANRQQTEVVQQHQEQLAATVAAAPAPADAPAASGIAGMPGPQTTLGGYGEIAYNRPTKDGSQSQADLRRAVILISHRFDDKTRMVSEFEWEHAVTSASDQGESEVEQLYVERELNDSLRAKFGLFLMPAGLLNSNHEPTAYYGVERNFVETAIIPSTWREAGVGLSGDLPYGLAWDAGITTGFDLTKWDATSTEGRDSPLFSIHQEGQLAKARNLSGHAALNWRGVPGLLLGGFIFSGKISHDTPGFLAQDARATLWDLHARYTPGPWDLSAVYTRGTISGAGALNQTFAGSITPVPASFYGWYTQAAYQAWKSGDYTLSPFARFERFNTASRYADMPPGLELATLPDEKVFTVGANFRIGEGVVLKADYQKFREDSLRNRFDLGVGYAF